MPTRPVPAPTQTGPLPIGPLEIGPLQIGLVNNMPDAALEPTERQFARLLHAAGGGAVRLHLFQLADLPRGAATRAALRGRYREAEGLGEAGLDAVVVTGAEPRAAALTDEPFWPGLARVIDWAAHEAGGAVFSCLAAHAAVMRLDGVRRRPLAAKLSGVFAVEADARHPWMRGAPARPVVPHSRANGLDAGDLARAGYELLSGGGAVGVDAFARPGARPVLLLQGHPEYEADTLAREYLRDVGRALRGERSTPPATPTGYLHPEVEAALAAAAARGEARPSPYARAVEARPIADPWRGFAEGLFTRWLQAVAARKAERAPRSIASPASVQAPAHAVAAA